MVFEPEQQDNIYERIRLAVANASAISNFSLNSPEKAITDDGFSAEMRERQHEVLAVQLSAYIDYAGKDITEQDLDDLGIDSENIDLDLLNSYVDRSDLDRLARRYSVFRDPGSFATGTVTFQTSNSEVVIPEGTPVGTRPDAEGDFLEFETTEEVVSAQGSTEVDASIQAVERGLDHNVGPDSITYLPESISGVNGDPPVSNAGSTTGGEAEETQSELRERAREAFVGTSGGGTLEGFENGLVAKFEGLDDTDVKVVEYPNQDPVAFDYIVDGGPSESELENAKDDLRPLAIEGTLVRPSKITLDISADVNGTDIDVASVEEDLRDYITTLGLESTYVIDRVIQVIMNGDSGIESIENLTHTVVDETITYQSGTSVYSLARSPIVTDSIANVEDDSGDAYINGTDYEELDGNSDGNQDSIDWSIGGSNPDDSEDFFLDYEVDHDIEFGSREKPVPGSVSITVI